MKTVSVIFILSFLTIQLICQEIIVSKTLDSGHPSVVAILRVDPAGGAFVNGSGTLIHPQVVLTAGHINFNTVKYWQGGCQSQGKVVSGENAYHPDKEQTFDWLKDVQIHPDSAYFLKSFADTTGKTLPTMFIDLGLVFLDRPVLNIPVAKLPKASILDKHGISQSFCGAGYGYNKTFDTTFVPLNIDGFKRKWEFQSISLINDLWLSVDCDPVSKLPYMSIFDSGAPVIYNDNTVIGVWSWNGEAKEPCALSSRAIRIDNPKVLTWIRESIKKRLGVDMCVDILQD